VVSFFSRKESKAPVLDEFNYSSDTLLFPTSVRAHSWNCSIGSVVFFFSRKEAKALALGLVRLQEAKSVGIGFSSIAHRL
jgi:hypothetical protein